MIVVLDVYSSVYYLQTVYLLLYYQTVYNKFSMDSCLVNECRIFLLDSWLWREREVTCGFCMIHWSFLDRFLLKHGLQEWNVTFLLLVCSVSCIVSTVSDTLAFWAPSSHFVSHWVCCQVLGQSESLTST